MVFIHSKYTIDDDGEDVYFILLSSYRKYKPLIIVPLLPSEFRHFLLNARTSRMCCLIKLGSTSRLHCKLTSTIWFKKAYVACHLFISLPSSLMDYDWGWEIKGIMIELLFYQLVISYRGYGFSLLSIYKGAMDFKYSATGHCLENCWIIIIEILTTIP